MPWDITFSTESGRTFRLRTDSNEPFVECSLADYARIHQEFAKLKSDPSWIERIVNTWVSAAESVLGPCDRGVVDNHIVAWQRQGEQQRTFAKLTIS